ncbi:hypothetical protein B0H15DRAFT_801997 [Mycena belliarum]|uniref:Uncharacterized protein n=1 Tax=Mycena belliarum TaxID=1033014 RepID=A0AAD6U2B8_9AGAR|nr:hypothetical protein B0H15DRAFT_801997 [Mycena belliae]
MLLESHPHCAPSLYRETVVQLPPEFDSLMESLRENRSAQLATVDQQHKLMKYVRGLNEWLEQDVHDHQAELRVDQLRDDMRAIPAQGAFLDLTIAAVFLPFLDVQQPQQGSQYAPTPTVVRPTSSGFHPQQQQRPPPPQTIIIQQPPQQQPQRPGMMPSVGFHTVHNCNS